MNELSDNTGQGVLYLVGARGYSAYEIAQQNGYSGTEEEWLASLQGQRGYSAYEIALQNGYEGSEEEWVEEFLSPDGYYTKEEIDEKETSQDTAIEALTGNYRQFVYDKLDEMYEDGDLEEYFAEYAHKMNWFQVDTTFTQTQIQEIMNTEGSKIIEFKTGNYNFNQPFRLNANTILLLNASVLTFTYRHSFYNFLSTDEFTEYNGNGNIKILNGVIKGGGISFCHANNILLKNLSFEDIINDHVLEIAANQNYIVDNCKFEGVAVQSSSRNYVECIQIDDMSRTTFPWFDTADNASYDETVNNIIKITNCSFISPNSQTTVKPNVSLYTCIGGHSDESTGNKNIYIDNCYFEGWSYAAIREFHWIKTVIDNCKFVNKSLYDEEENPYNYRRRISISNNYQVEDFTLKNSYFEGLTAVYWSGNVTKSENIYILNNTFINQNIPYYYENDVKKPGLTSLMGDNAGIIHIRQCYGELVIKDNREIESQYQFLHIDSRYGSIDDPKLCTCEIYNNEVILNFAYAILRLYANMKYRIKDNIFKVLSKYDNSLTSYSNQGLIRTSTIGKEDGLIIYNNVYNDPTILKIYDPQASSYVNNSLANVFDISFSLLNFDEEDSSFTNETVIYNRTVKDFNEIYFAIHYDNKAGIIVFRRIYNDRKMIEGTYYGMVAIDGTTIYGSLTINNDETLSGSVSNGTIAFVNGINHY